MIEKISGSDQCQTKVQAGDRLTFHKESKAGMTLLSIYRPSVGLLRWSEGSDDDKFDVSHLLSAVNDPVGVVLFAELISAFLGLGRGYTTNDVTTLPKGWDIVLKRRD